MAGIGEGGLNIAHEAVDRHLADGLGDKLAIKWLGKTGRVREFTYRQLADQTSRFAHLLQQFGIARGERVFGLAPRVPELYIAALGTMKAGAVFSPLFSAFGPEPVRTRMEIGDARELVTTKKLYDKTVAKWRHEMPNLRLILLVDGGEATPNENGVVGLEPALLAASAEFATVETDPEDMALLHFTSGTTGRPKGAIHVHQAVLSHHVTGAFALDLHRDDVFWCTADPGWVTGISYSMIAPLTNGVTMIVDEAEFDAARWYDLLRRERVTVWYTAPTAIRMLMRVGEAAFPAGGLPDLRFMASVGEPLNPEAVWWSQRVFGQPFHDNWWQTETGGIMIANTADMDIKPGSMGRPLPGLTAAIVNRHGDSVEEIVAPDTIGDLALRPGWPSMFRGYLHDDARYKKCFVDGWYITGDLATRDADGYFWFVGRGAVAGDVPAID